MTAPVRLNVNGRPVTATVDDPNMPLLYVLRDSSMLHGPRFGCGLGQCGACTVHVDGKAVRSCVLPLSMVRPKEKIITLYFLPGQYLNEAAISSLLDVGRTPVHQALQRLEIDGLVEIMPRKGVIVLPDSIADDIAAILDPFGNATHTALAFNMVGEDVLITGAGPIGIMATAVARFTGARHVVITDVNDYRLELARRMGATRAINVQRESLDQTMNDLGMQEGFDVGLEMSGNAAAFRDMLRTMHHGGSIAILGIPPEDMAIDWNQVIFKGLTLKGIYGREMFETWYKMASMLQSGLKLEPIITHHFPVQDYLEGFEIMGSGKSGKVILDWSTL